MPRCAPSSFSLAVSVALAISIGACATGSSDPGAPPSSGSTGNDSTPDAGTPVNTADSNPADPTDTSTPDTFVPPVDETAVPDVANDAASETPVVAEDTAPPTPDAATDTPSSGDCAPVLNELQTGDGASASNEFVEIYNPCSDAVDLSGYTLDYISSTGTTPTTLLDLSTLSSPSLASGGFAVIANAKYTAITASGTYAAGGLKNTGGGVGLVKDGKTVDGIAWGDAPSSHPYAVGGVVAAPNDTTPAHSVARKSDGVSTGDATTDFAVTSTPTPGANNSITP